MRSGTGNLASFSHYLYERKSWRITLAAVTLLLIGFIAMFVLHNIVYAGGGVGSGGNGTGACDYVCTLNGYAWAVYPIGSGGPAGSTEYAGGYRQFRDGSAWSGSSTSPYNVCSAAGASGVAVFIIYDSVGNGVGYNYLSGYSPPDDITSGPVDHGRATAITAGAAWTAYSSVPPSLKSGFNWGSNVGWFCYDVAPPTVTVEGLIINGDTGQATSGIGMSVCDYTAAHPSEMVGVSWSGNVFSANVSAGAGLCIRINGNNISGTPVYILPDSGALNAATWATVQSYCNEGGSPAHCRFSSYEILGAPPSGVEGGFNFIYYPNRLPIGYLDGATCSNVWGWSEDPDSSSASINVKLAYSNGATQVVPANQYRADVDRVIGISGNHGFSTAPPESVRESTTPTSVSAYGIDVQTGQQVQLSNSPRTIPACDHPPTGTVGPATCSTPIVSGTASDPDDPSASIRVDVYVVGSGGGLPGYGSPGGNGHYVGSAYTSGGRYSFNLSNFEGYSVQTFYFYAIDIYYNGGAGPSNKYIGSVNFGNCAQPSCLTPSVTASEEEDNVPEPHEPFDVTGHATWSPYNVYGTGTPPGISLSTPGLTELSDGGPKYPTGASPQPGGGSLGENEAFTLEADSPGVYTVTETIAGKSCSTQVKVANKPYAHFFINDVEAGGSFDSGNDQCASETPGSGKISAYTANTGYPLRGSGAQFGSIAFGSIHDFGSASLRTRSAGSPLALNGLMFANTPTGTQGSLGATPPPCIPNYSQPTPSDLPNYVGPWSGSLNSAKDQVYSFGSGDLTVPTIPNGINVVIYASGSVTIDNSIKYNPNGWSINPGSSDLTNVPSLYVIANGDINIDPGVTELDGVYVAQGGNINTCYGPIVPGNHASFSSCNNQLTVYGSLIANNINLYRTMASLSDSDGGEYPSNLGSIGSGAPAGNCDTGDNNSLGMTSNPERNNNYDCATELFIFSPANYLSSPALPAIGGPQTGKFDAISSLSPVL